MRCRCADAGTHSVWILETIVAVALSWLQLEVVRSGIHNPKPPSTGASFDSGQASKSNRVALDAIDKLDKANVDTTVMGGRHNVRLTRRQLLKLAGAASALLPLRRLAAQPPRLNNQGIVRPFLNLREYRDLDALTARILPTDTLPGAHEARVADYLQGMLSALPAADANCDGQRTAADLTAIVQQLGSPADPACSGADVNFDESIRAADSQSAEITLFEAQPIFAGAPFSGRKPFGDFAAGQSTETFPRNAFNDFLPLNRLQRISWTVRLDGADGVPEVADNPLALDSPFVDLRAKYRQGLTELDRISSETFGPNFFRLTEQQQDMVIDETPSTFINLITEHVMEGLLCDPVYGGNRDFVGWELVGFDGDSQPLGYTLGYDEGTQQHIDRADKPNSKPNPDEDCAGFTSRVINFLSVVAGAEQTRPGMRFRNPYCFEVGS